VINASRRGPKPKNKSKFSVDTFESVVEDIQSGRMPLKKVTIVDDVQVGLRAIIRESGVIAYHVHYEYKDSRPLLKIGEHPSMTINRARDLAQTIITLAKQGIDVQEGLHDRLMRELEKEKTNWRPR